jgi:hypothetical protein
MSAIVLTSETLIGTPAPGNIEYNGQFFGTDSASSRAQLQRIVRTTAQNSTSGTVIDFTGIPAWVEKITVMFQGVSTNGASVVIIQLGTGSTTYTTSGYLGSAGSNATLALFTTGIATTSVRSAAYVNHGAITITNITGNSWVASGTMGSSDGAVISYTGSSIALAALLTAVRITTVNGTDVFDAGTINIIYEG